VTRQREGERVRERERESERGRESPREGERVRERERGGRARAREGGRKSVGGLGGERNSARAIRMDDPSRSFRPVVTAL